MTIDTLHPLVAEYLRRLRRAAAKLPPDRRAELVAEIEAHLADALDPGVTDAEALRVLRRLGPPEAIVEAEEPPAAPARREPRGRKEWLAMILLLFGGFFAGFGWFVGAILLWSSRAWTVREKLIGTLVVPGGLALPFFILGMTGVSDESCGAVSTRCAPTSTQIAWMVVVGILALASIGTSTFLSNRARCSSG